MQPSFPPQAVWVDHNTCFRLAKLTSSMRDLLEEISLAHSVREVTIFIRQRCSLSGPITSVHKLTTLQNSVMTPLNELSCKLAELQTVIYTSSLNIGFSGSVSSSPSSSPVPTPVSYVEQSILTKRKHSFASSADEGEERRGSIISSPSSPTQSPSETVYNEVYTNNINMNNINSPMMYKKKREEQVERREEKNTITETANSEAIRLGGSVFNSERKKSRRARAKASPHSVTLSCRACGETKTCEWRRGPDGYKSLCNACGIHYAKIVKKEELISASYIPKSIGINNLLC